MPSDSFQTPTSASVLMPAIARLGIPVFIFGAAFFVIAIVLTLMLSPDRFPVRVGDTTVRLYELESEEKRLRSAQADLYEERQKILTDADAPVLRQIEKLRTGIVPIGAALMTLEEIRQSFRVGSGDPIAFPEMAFEATTNTLTLTGEVRDAGGRSMQILASFADELRSSGVFNSMSEPEYLSEALAGGGTVSRFSLTLRPSHE